MKLSGNNFITGGGSGIGRGHLSPMLASCFWIAPVALWIWPLSADAFEDQIFFLASRGYRSSRMIVAGRRYGAMLGARSSFFGAPTTAF